MDFKKIIYEKQDGIAKITYNKPEKLNAVCQDMIDEILAALKDARYDETIKCLIYTGFGDKAFCVGHDMNIFKQWYGFSPDKKTRKETQEFKLRRDRKLAEYYNEMLLFPKVTIAQVNGKAIGAGMMVIVACDMAFAADTATFSHSEMRFGHGGTTYILPFQIAQYGYKRARQLALTGETIDPAEAKRIGIINDYVPADKLEEEVLRYAKAVCLTPADGIAIGKAHIHMALDAMGITSGFASGYVGHALFNNLRYGEGDYNFFKNAAEKGLKAAVHERNDRYEKLGFE